MDSLNDELTMDQKQAIYNKCKYIVEKDYLPVMQEIYDEQFTTIVTNGIKHYDNDLWNANWRWLVPGTFLGPTNQDSSGFYRSYLVDTSGVSQETIDNLVSKVDANEEPLASMVASGSSVMTISVDHPSIKELADIYAMNAQNLMAIFPGNTVGKTFKVDPTKNQNTYTSLSDILTNYSVDILTVNTSEEIVDFIHDNGKATVDLMDDLKYKLADDWIKAEYDASSNLFDGATSLDTYKPELSTNEKYQNWISVKALDVAKTEVLSDIEVLGYNYGFLPIGYTGADSDPAPVYVAPGFSHPTIGQIKAQQDTSGTVFFSDGVELVDLQVVYDVSLPFLFVYRQHYTIARTTADGVIAGTPLDFSNTPIAIVDLPTLSKPSAIWSKIARTSSSLSRRITYVGYKYQDAIRKQAKLLWNQAAIQQDYYTSGFVDTYLLEPGVNGSREISNFITFVSIEQTGGGGWGACEASLNPTGDGAWVTCDVYDETPYSSVGIHPNASVQIGPHEGYFGHGVQFVYGIYNKLNGIVESTPWPITGLSTRAYEAYTSPIFAGPNFEGIAVYGELYSVCLGYRCEISMTNEVTAAQNFRSYILGMNNLSRVPARQVIDISYNTPKYGCSTAKCIQMYNDYMDSPFSETSSFAVRTMVTPGQQLTYNTGLCTNIACRNLLSQLIAENMTGKVLDGAKYTVLRFGSPYLFVDPSLAFDYFTANYANYAKDD